MMDVFGKYKGITFGPDTDSGGNDGKTDEKSTDWEASYKGMQREFQKLQSTSAAAVSSLTQDKSTLEARVKELEKQMLEKDAVITNKDAEVKRLSDETTGAKTTAERALSDLKRSKLIMKEFPELVLFEAGELLPVAANEDELRTKLTAYKTAQQSLLDRQMKDHLAGGAPPPPPTKTPTGDSVDQLWDALMAISRDPKRQNEYEPMYQKWLAASNAKK